MLLFSTKKESPRIRLKCIHPLTAISNLLLLYQSSPDYRDCPIDLIINSYVLVMYGLG